MSRKTTDRDPDSYAFSVRRLSKSEGGGFLVEYPDIPGCMSDGESVQEALENGRTALLDCLAVFRESGRELPRPAPVAAAQGGSDYRGPSTRNYLLRHRLRA